MRILKGVLVRMTEIGRYCENIPQYLSRGKLQPSMKTFEALCPTIRLLSGPRCEFPCPRDCARSRTHSASIKPASPSHLLLSAVPNLAKVRDSTDAPFSGFCVCAVAQMRQLQTRWMDGYGHAAFSRCAASLLHSSVRVRCAIRLKAGRGLFDASRCRAWRLFLLIRHVSAGSFQIHATSHVEDS